MNIYKRTVIAGLLSFAWAVPAFAGLDVYAGPLGKFYKNDYLSTQAEIAKEMGIEFKTVYPDGEPKWLTDKNATKKIETFRGAIAIQTKASSSSSPDMAKWNESADDHFIEQLNWDSLAALIHITAYAIREDLERPKEFSGDYEDYPAFDEAVDNDYYFGPLAVLESDMYLPSKGSTIIFQDSPLKEELMITTTGNLKMTLLFLDKRVWQGKATPQIWFDRGPATQGVGQELRISEETGEPEMVEVEYPAIADPALHNAEYAYSVLFKVLSYAETHNVPIVMDG